MAKEERQTNYTISEVYSLPSKGLIYDQPVDADVELRSMTARDEMKRTNPSVTPLKTLANLIEGCMIEKPAIHVYDMAIGDYEYLLHKLRVISYGPEYKIALQCPHCGELAEATTNLDDLKVKAFDKDEFDSLHTFSLPVSKRIVKLRFLTPSLLDRIDQKAKDLKKKAGASADIDLSAYATLASIVEEVDGEPMNSITIDYFIDDLPARDFNKILNMSEKLNAYVGLDTTLNIKCNHCGEDITTFFRFGPEFFRPAED